MRQIQIQLQILHIQSTVIEIDVKREAGSAGSHRSYRTRTMNPRSSTGLHTRRRPQRRLFGNTCHRNAEIQNYKTKTFRNVFWYILKIEMCSSRPGVAPLCCLDIVQESFLVGILDSDCPQIARLPDCQIARLPDCQIAILPGARRDSAVSCLNKCI